MSKGDGLVDKLDLAENVISSIPKDVDIIDVLGKGTDIIGSIPKDIDVIGSIREGADILESIPKGKDLEKLDFDEIAILPKAELGQSKASIRRDIFSSVYEDDLCHPAECPPSPEDDECAPDFGCNPDWEECFPDHGYDCRPEGLLCNPADWL